MIKPSSAIRQNDGGVSDLCKATQEPLYLTVNGEGDLAVMSMEAIERRDKMLALREALIRVEEDRLAGRRGCTVDELDAFLDETIREAKNRGNI